MLSVVLRLFLGLTMVALWPASGPGQEPAAPGVPTADQLEYFENHIRPLLIDHCLDCHGADPNKIRGGLWLTSRSQILAGGDSGPAIVPGKPDESLLMSAVHYEDFEMPPAGQLEDQQLQHLEAWIRMGAPDPRQPEAGAGPASIDLEAGRRFWAFQPRQSAAPPAVTDFSKDPIDRWIADAWSARGLRPAPDADRLTLVRRVYLDLIGLPPTPQEIREFVDSEAPLTEALATLVDRLLESPHFGERWGRHWLDVARFAESSGGGRSLMFPDAWRYRDYIIQAYNEDRPFDQLIREQLAGDQLQRPTPEQQSQAVVATGFLALGPTNYEQQDKQRLAMEVVDEQVDTLGRAFLGLTLGCARCHDHKFDPIPMRDYYALAGIFSSTQSLVDGNVSSYVTRPLASQAELDAQAAYQKRLRELDGRLKKAQAELARLGGPAEQVAGDGRVRKLRSDQLPGLVIDDTQARKLGTWTPSVSVPRYVDAGYIHDDRQPKGAQQVVYSPKFETGGRYEVRLAYSPGGNRASNVPVTIVHQDGQVTHRVNQSQEPPLDGLFVSLGVYRFEADNVATVTISNEGTDGVVIADAVQFLLQSAATDPDASEGPEPSAAKPVAATPATVDPARVQAEKQVQALDEALRQLKKQAPPPLPLAMSVRDVAQPQDGHIHIRGSVRNLGEQVPRGFLQVVTPVDTWPRIPTGSSGRRELAEWIASPDNPLTARVYANRVWRHLMGRGLVRTTDNFGQMGERPSHPELLDYLANRLVASGWSTKQLIREIMLARVYRLSSTPDADNAAVDPDNIYRWRADRRRLDAEVLRDSILAASGELDRSPGGLTIRKLSQYDLGYEFDTVRRSVYVPAFRNSMLDLFTVFDMANPNMVLGDRNTSTLPTQALFLMNSPFVMDQARAAAERLVREAGNESARLELAYLRILGRPPTEAERQLSRTFLDAAVADDPDPGEASVRAWSQLVQALWGSLDFRFQH